MGRLMNKEINKEELRYVTQGEISKAVYMALLNASSKHSIIINMTLVGYIVIIFFSIYCLLQHQIIYFILSICTLVLCISLLTWTRHYTVNTSVRRIRELNGSDTSPEITGFTDDFVYTENLNYPDRSLTITYDHIHHIYDTKHYIFLITNGSQFLTVFKDNLTKNEATELARFLKGKISHSHTMLK